MERLLIYLITSYSGFKEWLIAEMFQTNFSTVVREEKLKWRDREGGGAIF